jgi:hypothetical protein
MGFWRRRRTFPGQGEARIDAELAADMRSDTDAVDHDEQDVFTQLGADPEDVSGLVGPPIGRDQNVANSVVADMDAIDRDEDRMVDELRDRGDGSEAT